MFHLSDLELCWISSDLELCWFSLAFNQSPWHHTVVGLPSFKDTLLSACDEYMRSNDCGNDKTWSMLITQISQEIAAIVHEKNERVLEELEK